jgi:hypothetical protein
MNIVKKMICLIVSILFVTPILTTLSAEAGKLDHFIAGYGAVKGEIVSPVSLCIRGNQLFILDSFGVSSYDLVSMKLINQFKVDLGEINVSDQWDDPKAWTTLLKSFSGGIQSMLDKSLNGTGTLNLAGTSENVLIKPDLLFDSKGNLFILSKKGIQQFDPNNGSVAKIWPIPGLDPLNP